MAEYIYAERVLSSKRYEDGLVESMVDPYGERREEIVRCRDCASIKPTTDGRRYCKRWSHIVPLDGFCWRGEAKSGEEAQEG